MITDNKHKALCAVFCGSMLWGHAAFANEALELLGRMQTAVAGLEYSGELVYSRSGEMSTYSISHQLGQAQENIIRLDGAASEQAESFSLANFGNLHTSGMEAYAFDLGGDANVANQPCKVVVVRPKDKMRYLHRYCIAPSNGMLLKYSLMDREQKVLEQLIFTKLSISPPLAPAEAAQPVALARLAAPSVASPAIAAAPLAETGIEEEGKKILESWEFQNLPPGFKVVKVVPERESDDAHQIVLSDGMTSVSVFIAPAASAKDINDVSYSSGATHILGLELAGHVITFVGEVPSATLQSIQKGLRYVAR